MIHFDFMLTEEDAELLFDCVQQQIANLKESCLQYMNTNNIGNLNYNIKYAIDSHIKRLEYIKEKMHNKKVE